MGPEFLVELWNTSPVLFLLIVYGPLALAWPVAFFLGKWILNNYKADIESRAGMTNAIRDLKEWLKEKYMDRQSGF